VRKPGPRLPAFAKPGSIVANLSTSERANCEYAIVVQLFRAKHRDVALFKRTLTAIVMEGGDADTNGAIAGVLLGAAIGYRQLPGEWLAALPYHDWLLQEIDAWIASGGVPELGPRE
jgi:hypothetical protein